MVVVVVVKLILLRIGRRIEQIGRNDTKQIGQLSVVQIGRSGVGQQVLGEVILVCRCVVTHSTFHFFS